MSFFWLGCASVAERVDVWKGGVQERPSCKVRFLARSIRNEKTNRQRIFTGEASEAVTVKRAEKSVDNADLWGTSEL